MPKQVYKITRFDGGVNSDSDPRDISDNELAAATDIDTSAIGRITMLGGFTEHEATLNTVGQEPAGGGDLGGQAGTGLFSFSSDYQIIDTNGNIVTSTAPKETDYIALYTDNASSARVGLFQRTSDASPVFEWNDYSDSADRFPLGGATAKLSFYVVNGNLRVSDYSNTASNVSKWLGVITPKLYGDDSGGGTRQYGNFHGSGVNYNTTCIADVERTGTADTYKPLFVNQKIASVMADGTEIKGCFPEEDNGDGDKCASNAIAYSAWSQWTERTSDTFRYYNGTPANDSSITDDANNDGTVDGTRLYGFEAGDKVRVYGFLGNSGNNWNYVPSDGSGNGTLKAASDSQLVIDTEVGANENSGELVKIARIQANSDENQVAGGAAFAYEGTDIGSDHSSAGAGASLRWWGAGLIFAEDTNGNNTGTWMPSRNTRYKFYITTVFDDGTQESLPQLMAMYGSEGMVEGAATEYELDFSGTTAKSDLYFCKGVAEKDQTKSTHAVKGENIALHLKPILKINGARYDTTTNADKFAFGANAVASIVGNPRISGVRIYWASSDDGYSELWRIFDCDFYKGTKTYGMDSTSGSGGWAPWQHIGMYPNSDLATNAYGHYMIPDWDTGNKFTSPPKFLSYFTANGHSHNEDIVLNSFKSAVVANNRVYAGNVNQTVDGQPTQFSDRIMKSPIGQFDKFPASNYLQVAKNDGDEIVALATFGDRLLQFNKNVMYIINISQVDEFMESEHKFKGIVSPASVFTTDKGIAWANKLGAYFYDGNRVHNLLRRKETSLISQSTWSTFADTAIMTGYISSKNQLIFGADIGTGDDEAGDGEAYIYSLTTRSWVRASTGTVADAIKTNFTSDYNGDLIYYDYTAEKMLKWDSSPDSSTYLNMLTKDIDFGQPSVRKKIYKVYISYKGDASAVELRYRINGDTNTPTTQFYRTQADGSSDGTNADSTPLLNIDTNDWVNAELIPTAAINNIYSFQLYFEGTGAADFEINDISIVYRMKSIK
tara:strand:+ start:54 stop:3065 length:3012 start_codon:yes stop_codon:yes gene_type:complete